MVRRIIFFTVIVVALIALIVYSQIQPQSNYVSGLIESEEIRLGSRIGGRVKRVLVAEGDRVTKSMPLVEFEPYDLNEREQQAVSVLAEREAVLKKMKTGMRDEEIAQAKSRYDRAREQLSLTQEGARPEEITAAENRLTVAKSELKLAKREYDRISSLHQQNAISKSEFDSADQKWKSAVALVDVRKSELKILKDGARKQEIEIAKANVEDLRLAWELAKKGFRTEDIEQAQAARDSAAASLEAIRSQKRELVLYAPADGIIDSLDLQPGDLVGPNAPVMTMLSTKNLKVRAYVPQRFLQLKVGQELRITVDSFPGEDFQGEVTFISNQAEFTPSNVQTPDDRAKQVYRIRVTLNGDTDKLRPGMTTNVWLDPK